MKIEYNEKEIAAMAEFHKGNRAEGLRLQEEFASEISKRICRQRPLPMSKKPVDIMEIAKNVWQFTEPIRNTFQTACAR